MMPRGRKRIRVRPGLRNVRRLPTSIWADDRARRRPVRGQLAPFDLRAARAALP
jgi:hypothetical protein